MNIICCMYNVLYLIKYITLEILFLTKRSYCKTFYFSNFLLRFLTTCLRIIHIISLSTGHLPIPRSTLECHRMLFHLKVTCQQPLHHSNTLCPSLQTSSNRAALYHHLAAKSNKLNPKLWEMQGKLLIKELHIQQSSYFIYSSFI